MGQFLSIGPVIQLIQNEIYALPAAKIRIYSDVPLEYSYNSNGPWVVYQPLANQVPVVNGSSSGHGGLGATSLTFNHTATGDPLYLSISLANSSTVTITYGGVPLTSLQRIVIPTSFHHEWFYLANPVVGTASIVITASGATNTLCAGVRNIRGADLTTTHKNMAQSSASSTAPSLTVTSVTGELVLDHLNNSANNQVYTPDPSQTVQYAQNNDVVVVGKCAGSSKAGAVSVTMSWTLSINGLWAMSGISIPGAVISETPPAAQGGFVRSPSSNALVTCKRK